MPIATKFPSLVTSSFISLLSTSGLSSNLGYQLFQGRRVGAHHVTGGLSILEGKESGHGTHTQFLSDVGDLVDVDLDELRIGMLSAELFEDGRDRLAGTAPDRIAVNEDDRVGFKRLLEVSRPISS